VDFHENGLLTAIIPLTSDLDRVSNVCKILSDCEYLPITIKIVFDSQDQVPFLLHEAINKRSSATMLTQGFWMNPGESRNAGLSNISTKWITFWDSDDTPYPSEVLKMIKLADGEGADSCVGAFELEVENKLEPEIFTPIKDNWVDSAIKYPGLWRFAFRNSLIHDKKFMKYSMGEDQEFLARALSGSRKVFATKELVYKYQTGASGQLTKKYRDFSELLSVFDDLYQLEKASTTQVTRLTGVMKAKVALTAIKKGSFSVKLRMISKIFGRLLHYKTFFSGEFGNGLLISILFRNKRGQSG
jgi:glycosyltransferase involved in cell wall biosynthesis